MKTAIQCPHCESAHVEVAKEFWFLYGFLVMARYGSKTLIGCQSCIQQKGITNFILVLLFGWWCFPWGIGTPFVVIQNLWTLSTNNDRKLVEVLNQIGVRPQDVAIGSDGLTQEQRNLFDGVIAILSEAIWADGDADPREIATAVGIASNLLDGAVSDSELRRRVSSPPSAQVSFNISSLNAEQRLLLFHSAMAIVAADERVDPGEARFLHELGKRLQLPGEIVDHLLESLTGLHGGEVLQESDPDRLVAFQILGAALNSSAPELKRNYRKLCIRHHPDRHANHKAQIELAHQCMTWLNWSYKRALEGRSAGAPPGQSPPSILLAQG